MKTSIKMGQMLAFARMGDFEEVDNILHSIDSELWLVTELTSLEDVEDFIYGYGEDLWE